MNLGLAAPTIVVALIFGALWALTLSPLAVDWSSYLDEGMRFPFDMVPMVWAVPLWGAWAEG